MVLIRVLALVLGIAAFAGCKQSLFDNNGDRDASGGSDTSDVPSTCPTPCLGDAAGDYNGSVGGSNNRWRYLEDHRDRTWVAMSASAGNMTGAADPANQITTCAAKPGAEACKALPGALLVSSGGSTSAADPAVEFTAMTSQVVQLTVRARVPNGADGQLVRIYRNSREDVLFTQMAAAGVTFDHAITLDALAGDRFLVALAPIANGATDVGLHVFLSATGASFPSTCQLAVPFSAATGNTVDNLCGGDLTHNDYGTGTMTPPTLGFGPFTEQGLAADLAANTYFQGANTLDKTGDTTVQLWVKLRALVGTDAAWAFSDHDLDNAGGVGLVFYDQGGLMMEVDSCSLANPLTFVGDRVPYPTDASWNFIRIVHTNGNVVVCLNGKRALSFPVAQGKLGSTYPPYVGKNVIWTPAGAFFDGEIDDVRVLTGALPCE